MGVFSKVGGYKPSRTAFNLSHSNLVDMGFGELIPVGCIECIPGDTYRINSNIVGRLTSALNSPILADMDLIVEAFFCPTRLLQGSDANFDVPVGERNFEELLVGGKNGNEDIEAPHYGLTQDSWVYFENGGIADVLGIQPQTKIDIVDAPVVYPWRAYRWIWNEYYRFESLQEPVQVCQYLGDGTNTDSSRIDDVDYDKFLYRGWRRDYFTSALPYQQFGTSPAFDVNGTLPVDINLPGFTFTQGTGNVTFTGGRTFDSNQQYKGFTGSGNTIVLSNGNSLDNSVVSGSVSLAGGSVSANGKATGTVDLSNAVTFDISEIRTNFQIQKWMERNARGGVRYTEYLRSHFGVAPNDSRLQRPEFIGAFRMPWLVSEVLQTSATSDGSSPQGNQAGQSIALGRGKLGKYRCYEFGYIMFIASVVPKPQYQQGLPRMFSRKNRFDFYSPEFAHLSEQAILNKELFVTGDTTVDNDILAFQGIFNELRFLPSRVSRHMRTNAPEYSFDYWHLARYFASKPSYNKEFLEVGSTESSKKELMRIFAVQDENPFIVNFGFDIKAVRPLPYLAEPGLVDHF